MLLMFTHVSSIVFGLAYVGAGSWLLLEREPTPPAAPPAPTELVQMAAVSPDPSEVAPPSTSPTVLPRSSDGLFYVDGVLNGHPIRFLVDTGASVMVLTPEDAARIGVSPQGEASVIQTANGSAAMSWTKLRTLRIAGKQVNGASAAIAAGGLKVSLLGQNVLAELGSVTMTRDKLVIDS